MYLFGRSVIAHPNRSAAAFGAAVEVAGMVSQTTGHESEVWTTFLSPDTGRILWTTWFEHLEDAATASAKLMADSAYLEWVERHEGTFLPGVTDSLSQMIHGAPDDRDVRFVSSVAAVCANGMLGAGMAMGVEIAEAATRVTGLPTLFASATTGPYGGVSWFVGAEAVGELEAWQAKLTADPDWPALMDRAGACYAPGAISTMFTKIS